MRNEFVGALNWIDRIAFAGTGTSVVRGRAQPIEVLRIISAFGIVLFHVQSERGGGIGYAGLIVFLFLLAYFEARSKTTDVVSLIPKLVIPWIFWYSVFATANFAKMGRIFHTQQPIITDILSGPSPHLWFLPYAFLVCFLVRKLKLRLSHKLFGLSAGILSLVLIGTMYWWDALVFQAADPAPEYAISLIPITAGVSAALAPSLGWVLIIAGAFVGLYETVYLGVPFGVIYALGVSAVAVAMITSRAEWASRINVQSVSRYMFGVYLCHPLFISAMNATAIHSNMAKACFAFVLSLWFSWVLSGQPFRFLGRHRPQAV